MKRTTTAGIAAIAGSAILLTATATTAPAATKKATKKVSIAGIFEGLQDPFWTSVTCGAQSEAKKRGIELKLYTNAGMDSAKTATNLKTALLAKPNGVLSSPVNTQQFVADNQKLMKSGVPVVVSAPTTPRTEYQQIFSDTNTAGFAKEAISLIPAGAGSMVVLGGVPGIPPLEARTNPFIDAVKAARPDLKVLPTIYSGFDPNKAATDLGTVILANPDLKLIIAADGPDGMGAANAVDTAGAAGKIGVIAFDSIPPEVDALKKGTIQALIAQNPMEIGRRQVGAIADYLAKKKSGPVPMTAAPIGIPQKLLTAKTVDEAGNADYVYKGKC